MKTSEYNCYKHAAGNTLPDLERIRRNVLDDAKSAKARPKKAAWLAPALACVCAAAVICVAVPPVRAAVENFFRSVGAYMSVPKEERPEVEGVAVQEDIPAQTASVVVYEDFSENSTVPAQQDDWRNSVSVEVKEIMYDGEGLYMTYVIDGSAVGLSTYEIPGDLSKIDPNNAPLCTSASVILPDGSFIASKEQSVTNDGGLITVTAEFSERGNFLSGNGTIRGLNGEQTLQLKVGLLNAVFDMDRIKNHVPDYTRDYVDTGALTVPFTFNADNDMAVVDEHTYTVNGEAVIFDSVSIKPTDISIDVRIPFADEYRKVADRDFELSVKKEEEGLTKAEEAEFESVRQILDKCWNEGTEAWLYLDFDVYLDGNQLTPPNESFWNGLINNAENDAMVGQLVIPFPDQDAKELKLVPINRDTGEKYEADAITIPL